MSDAVLGLLLYAGAVALLAMVAGQARRRTRGSRATLAQMAAQREGAGLCAMEGEPENETTRRSGQVDSQNAVPRDENYHLRERNLGHADETASRRGRYAR